MLDHHLAGDGKQHDVHHRIDRIAGDHLDQLDTDDNQAGVTQTLLQIIRGNEQLLRIRGKHHAQAGNDTGDQDDRTECNLDRGRRGRDFIAHVRVHSFLLISKHDLSLAV